MITSAIQNLNLLPGPDPGELDQLKERIVELDAFCRQSFGKHMVYAFLCGVALNRAKQIAPHGNFTRWHQAELPQLSGATLHRYMIFAGGLLARFPALQKLKAAPLLERGDLAGTESQQLLEAVHEAADGKTISDFYRDLGVIRPPQPATHSPPERTAHRPPKPLSPPRQPAAEQARAEEFIESLLVRMRMLLDPQDQSLVRSGDAKREELLALGLDLNNRVRAMRTAKGTGRKPPHT